MGPLSFARGSAGILTRSRAVPGADVLPHCLRVEIPADAEALLMDAPEEAARWRADVRRSLQWCLAAGYSIAAFHPDEESNRGFYLMTKQQPARTSNGVSR